MGARLIGATAVAAMVVPLTLTAGCGSSDDTAAGNDPAATRSSSPMPSSPASSSAAASPTSRPAPVGWPSCGEVWKDGSTLPARYKGCSEGGLAITPQRLGCESGQTFVLYADHYWAVRGGTIQHSDRKLANSSAYAADVATCRG